jgi:predicted O-methyltransferase YrrM
MAGLRGVNGFADALAAVEGIGGWLTEDQARLLYERAAALPDGARIVEIGSYHGRSTIILALAASSAEIVAIDPFAAEQAATRERLRESDVGQRDLQRFEANLERAGVRDRIRHVRAFSSDALAEVDGRVDLLYVDGAHDLRHAFGDIRGWGARVREGGTMLVHDAFSSVGVTLAQMLALFASGEFRYAGRSRSLAEYRREHGASRAANAARQSAQLPWFARNVAVKAALVAHARPVAAALDHHEDVFPY